MCDKYASRVCSTYLICRLTIFAWKQLQLFKHSFKLFGGLYTNVHCARVISSSSAFVESQLRTLKFYFLCNSWSLCWFFVYSRKHLRWQLGRICICVFFSCLFLSFWDCLTCRLKYTCQRNIVIDVIYNALHWYCLDSNRCVTIESDFVVLCCVHGVIRNYVMDDIYGSNNI